MTDGAGNVATSAATTLTVTNTPPTIGQFNVPAAGFEASSIAVSATATDPAGAADPLTYSWTVKLGLVTVASGTGQSFAFTPADNGTYVVSLVVDDGDLGTATQSASVIVANVKPTIDSFTVPGAGSEGTAVNLVATASDVAGVNDPLTYTWTITRPNATTFTLTGASVTFTPADNGTFQASLTVDDGDGGTATQSGNLIVANVAPTATLSNSGPINEGSSATIAFTAPVDPSTADTAAGLRYSFALASSGLVSSYATAGAATSATFPFADNGSFTVYGRIFDKDNGFTDALTTVVVNNVAPTIAISGAATVNEGSVYTLTLGAVTDPGTDTVSSYIVHWGDGATGTFATAGAKSHTYADGPNTFAITVDLVDEDDTFLSVANAFSVTIANVAPTIAISGAATVNEGSVYTLTLGAVTDPGTDTVRSYIVHWGDGATGTFRTNGAKTHTYADGPNTFSITVDLVDEDGTFLSVANALSVSVINVAPTATMANSGPRFGGGPVGVSFTGGSDPSSVDAAGLIYSFDLNRDGDFTDAGETGPSPSAIFFAPTAGDFIVRGRVSDKDGGFTDYSTTVRVLPVHSTAAAIGSDVVVYREDGTVRFALRPYDNYKGAVTVAVGDVTGDGIDDIVTGSAIAVGHVKVFDGATGAEIASFLAYAGFEGGVSVAAGDVLGSGRAQVITGAGPGGGPHVKVFDLAGGGVSEVRSFFAYDPSFTGGVTVAAGDGRIVTAAGPGAGPHVKVFNVSVGTTEVLSFFAYPEAFQSGVSVAAGGGLIVAAAGPGGAPQVKLFRIADGAEVASFDAYEGFNGGVRVAMGLRSGVPTIVTGSGSGTIGHVKTFRRSDSVQLDSAFIGDPANLDGVYVG